MSRPLELVVEPHPPLGPRSYPMRVIAFRKEAAGLRVVLEHVASEQAGRQHEILLGLPLRPQSPAARFFAALGFDTSVGSRIDPRAAIGQQLLVTFGQTGGQEPRPVAFQPAQENPNAQHAE